MGFSLKDFAPILSTIALTVATGGAGGVVSAFKALPLFNKIAFGFNFASGLIGTKDQAGGDRGPNYSVAQPEELVDATARVPIGFGELRIYGRLIMLNKFSTLQTNKYVLLCEGEIEEIGDIEIDGNHEIGFLPLGVDQPNQVDYWVPNAEVTRLLGSDTQSKPGNGLLDGYRGGIPYHAGIVARIQQSPALSGKQIISARVRGLKCVKFDPVGAVWNDGSPEWTDNPVWLISEMLRSSRFGLQIDDQFIDGPSFAEVAAELDQGVSWPTLGDPVAIVNTGDTSFDVQAGQGVNFAVNDVVQAVGSTELMLVKSIAVDTLTVFRGQGGTTPQTIQAGTDLLRVDTWRQGFKNLCFGLDRYDSFTTGGVSSPGIQAPTPVLTDLHPAADAVKRGDYVGPKRDLEYLAKGWSVSVAAPGNTLTQLGVIDLGDNSASELLFNVAKIVLSFWTGDGRSYKGYRVRVSDKATQGPPAPGDASWSTPPTGADTGFGNSFLDPVAIEVDGRAPIRYVEISGYGNNGSISPNNFILSEVEVFEAVPAKRASWNRVLDEPKSVEDWIEEITLATGVHMGWDGSKFFLQRDKDPAPDFAEYPVDGFFEFNEDNITLDTIVASEIGQTDRPNQIVVVWYDHILRERREAHDNDLIDQDENGVRRNEVIALGITDPNQAARLARKLLNTAQLVRWSVTFNAAYDATAIRSGDVVLLSHADFGWSKKPFRVLNVEEVQDGDSRFDLQEHFPGIYDEQEGGFTQQQLESSFDQPFRTIEPPTLTDVVEVNADALNRANDGTWQAALLATWTNPDVDGFDSVSVQISPDGCTWEEVGRTAEQQFTIKPLTNKTAAGDWWYIRLVAIDQLGNRSAELDARDSSGLRLCDIGGVNDDPNTFPAGYPAVARKVQGKTPDGIDVAAPSQPTGFSAKFSGPLITLKWSGVFDKDLALYRLEETSGLLVDTIIHESKATEVVFDVSNAAMFGGVDANRRGPFDFALTAVDTSGNESTANNLIGVENTAPAPPTGPVVDDVTLQTAQVSWLPDVTVGDEDLDRYEIHASATPGFTPSRDTVVKPAPPTRRGSGGTPEPLSTTIKFPAGIGQGQPVYYRVAAVDLLSDIAGDTYALASMTAEFSKNIDVPPLTLPVQLDGAINDFTVQNPESVVFVGNTAFIGVTENWIYKIDLSNRTPVPWFNGTGAPGAPGGIISLAYDPTGDYIYALFRTAGSPVCARIGGTASATGTLDTVNAPWSGFTNPGYALLGGTAAGTLGIAYRNDLTTNTPSFVGHTSAGLAAVFAFSATPTPGLGNVQFQFWVFQTAGAMQSAIPAGFRIFSPGGVINILDCDYDPATQELWVIENNAYFAHAFDLSGALNPAPYTQTKTSAVAAPLGMAVNYQGGAPAYMLNCTNVGDQVKIIKIQT